MGASPRDTQLNHKFAISALRIIIEKIKNNSDPNIIINDMDELNEKYFSNLDEHIDKQLFVTFEDIHDLFHRLQPEQITRDLYLEVASTFEKIATELENLNLK